MSSEAATPLQITFTPEFKRNLRQLAKKYRHIKSDLQPILDQLTSGNKPGDQVPDVRYEVFKVRAKNSDASKGKSGGYRLIYYAKSASERILVTVYSKTEQADIARRKSARSSSTRRPRRRQKKCPSRRRTRPSKTLQQTDHAMTVLRIQRPLPREPTAERVRSQRKRAVAVL